MKISHKIGLWLGVAGCSWFLGYLWTSHLSLELSWVRSIYRKKIAVVEEHKNQNRIFIVGGSGTHMGLDTHRISQQLNRPVINLGLHAALGLEAIMASVKPYIQKGDIILLIPEYDIAADEDGIGRLAGEFGFLHGLIYQMDMSLEQKAQSLLKLGNPSLKSLYGTIVKISKKNAKQDYYTDRVDDFGNPVELKIRNPKALVVKQEQPSDQSIKKLKNFQEYINSKEADLIIGLPWFFTSDEKISRENVRNFIDKYKELAPVIYDKDYNLKTDPSVFGDTVYHLSYEGRKERSEALIQQLNSLIQEQAIRKN